LEFGDRLSEIRMVYRTFVILGLMWCSAENCAALADSIEDANAKVEEARSARSEELKKIRDAVAGKIESQIRIEENKPNPDVALIEELEAEKKSLDNEKLPRRWMEPKVRKKHKDANKKLIGRLLKLKIMYVRIKEREKAKSIDKEIEKIQSGAVDTDWISIFNGRDLSGWEPYPQQMGDWRVEDGVLIGSGPDLSHLCFSRGNYRDLHLRAEVRVNEGGNGGVFVRATDSLAFPPNRPRYPSGYEAQIAGPRHPDQAKTGSLFAGGEGYVVKIPTTRITGGQWFVLEVIASGNRIVVKVDGKVTADYVDENPRFLKGRIALQHHDAATSIEFRKIEVRPPVAR
jgi:hypothetical protein